MKRTLIYCDFCHKALSEEDTRELEQYIMVASDTESNVWMGPVSSWTPSILMKDDMYFCDWGCYRTWMADWYNEARKAKEPTDE